MKGANDPRELAHLIMGQLSNACIVAIKPGLVLEYKHTEHCDASTKSIEEYARPAPAGEMVRREDVARWLELRAEQSTILRTGYCAIASMLRDGAPNRARFCEQATALSHPCSATAPGSMTSPLWIRTPT